MKVVLRSDVDKLGEKGDIVEVADGYAATTWFLGARPERHQGCGRPGRSHASQPRRQGMRGPRRRPGRRGAALPRRRGEGPGGRGRPVCSARSRAPDIVAEAIGADRGRDRPSLAAARRAHQGTGPHEVVTKLHADVTVTVRHRRRRRISRGIPGRCPPAATHSRMTRPTARSSESVDGEAQVLHRLSTGLPGLVTHSPSTRRSWFCRRLKGNCGPVD